MSEPVVLDSSALLALLREEDGAERVAAVVAQAHMSVVNLAETLTVLGRYGMSLAEAERDVDGMELELVPADAPIARQAARIGTAFRAHGLSLGDAFCLATARVLGLPVVTADRAWARLAAGVPVTVIR